MTNPPENPVTLLAEALPYVADEMTRWDENDGAAGNRARQREARYLEARIRAVLAARVE